MHSRIPVRASIAALLCLVGGCAFLPAPRGPARAGEVRRSAERPAWTDLLACAVLTDSAATTRSDLPDACGKSRIDAGKPTEPLPRPSTTTP